MGNLKIELKRTKNGSTDSIHPKLSLDNMVSISGTTIVPEIIPTLDPITGFLDEDVLPEGFIGDVVQLVAITTSAPSSGFSKGDKYLNYNLSNNTGEKKIYTASANNTWGNTSDYIEDPKKGVIYINDADGKIYYWSGSVLGQLAKQITITNTVRTSGMVENSVPSEKAVRNAITGATSSFTYNLPVASTTSAGTLPNGGIPGLGGIKIDNLVFTVDASGVLKTKWDNNASSFSLISDSEAGPSNHQLITGGILRAFLLGGRVELPESTGGTYIEVTGVLDGYQLAMSNGTGVTGLGNGGNTVNFLTGTTYGYGMWYQTLT